jgi:hypothetical protein
MTRQLALWLALLVGLAIRCATLTGAGSTTLTEPGVLFQDDFSDPSSRWDRVSAGSGLTGYVDDAYRIHLDEPHADDWANPGQAFSDVGVEVQATKAAGLRPMIPRSSASATTSRTPTMAW